MTQTMSWWNAMSFQDSTSPLMNQLIMFHDHTLTIMLLIMSIVGYLMFKPMNNLLINRFLLENHTLEMVWTLTPAIVLLMIALPSLRLLYLLDETFKPLITIKSMGNQWFWTYEYSDFKNIEFDSYLLTQDTNLMSFRLAEVDNNIVIPLNHQIRMITSSNDVIHSWTIPSLGVKADAVPGRLNQMSFTSNQIGISFGQCSEICGMNHSFMPIALETVNLKRFINWLKSF